MQPAPAATPPPPARLELREYLVAHTLSAAAFARQIGVTRAAISQIATGRMRPSPELASRIEAATGGSVSAHALVFGRAPSSR
ncbi:MAG: helix-turn-helix domain-containing protein [Dehalococcoidia bacterium]|nr:helix-turn-helix domain-containing protein [Dehalococcoidia bacterium]